VNFDRAQEHFYRELRRFAVLLLTDRAHQALNASRRMAGDSAQAEGGQLTGWPPAPAQRCRLAQTVNTSSMSEKETALYTLASLLLREAKNAATPAETREIAELWEFLDCGEDAVLWWEKAAARGDEDAKDYLEVLQSESMGMVSDPQASLCADHPPQPRGLHDSLVIALHMGSSCTLSAYSRSRHHHPPAEPTWDVSEDLRPAVKRMVEEIEAFLAHPDQMTDGRTR
jgi:hypothetical protein